ncbi:MAG: methionine--tRNA ligase [Desulfomonile sp.]|nr:methionine--tRNA ligase [Desulfomonile sp.]
MSKILVTSALPYANGDIHIGHLVEYIQTDIFVRFQRLIGRDVIYVCASDAHGTPIEINAAKKGITPEELVKHFHQRHKNDFARFEVDFDEFYTTDSPENRRHCEAIYLAAKEKGHIASREIEQSYCEQCGRFLPDRFIRGTCPKCGALDQYGDVCEVCSGTYQPTDLVDPRCAICGSQPTVRRSKHYFFRLDDFRDFLVKWAAEPGRLQEEAHAFVRSWIDQGLQDWDISRDGPYFGFKIPGEEDKFFYVWVDAPIGYIAATEHYCNTRGDCSVEEYWIHSNSDAEIHHFIGKDIAYFHILFWPAMLRAADYRTPTAVHVHGFLTVDGRKMSKSRGTFITARQFAEFIPPWCLRYYYATKLGNSIDDLDLNADEFVTRINAELVNNITNLVSRTFGFLNKRLDSRIGAIPDDARELIPEVLAAVDRARAHYLDFRFGQATREVLVITDLANNYIQQSQPWSAIKADPERARDILTFAVNCIKVAAVLLKPILPSYSRRLEELLGCGDLMWCDAVFNLERSEIGLFEKLMDRLEPGAFDKLIEASRGSLAALQAVSELPPFSTEEITIEEFAKMDLRVGKIVAAHDVEGADKLLKLEVDLGHEVRTIFAGIKKTYSPEQLLGRTVAVIANLKPRKMKFGTSHGMVLAGVGPDGSVTLCELAPTAQPGSQIR